MDKRPWTVGPVHLGELVIGFIAVALHEVPAIALEEAKRMHGAAAGRVVEHHHGRAGTAVPPVISNNGPEVAGFRFSSPGIEHRGAGFVHEHPVCALQPLLQVVCDGAQVETGASHPVSERRPIQRDPLPGVDFGLAVKRKVVAELGHHDLRDQRFGGQAAGHDMFRRMRLDHRAGTAPAGISGAPGDQHAELGRHHIQPFGDVFADPGHLAATAGTERALGLDDPFDPGQVFRKVAAVAVRGAALGCTLPLQRASRLLLRRVQHALRQFHIFERQVELHRIELFGSPPEPLPPQLADDALQPLLGLDRIHERRLGLGEAGLQKRVFFGQGGVGHDRDQAHGRDHHHGQIIAESLCRS